MEAKIAQWYTDKGFGIKRIMYQARRQGIDRQSVLAAMTHCYKKIVEDGKLIHDIDIIRYVFSVARDGQDMKELKDIKKADVAAKKGLIYKAELSRMHDRAADAEKREKRLKWLALILAGVSAAYAAGGIL